ncbi:hypothetical protein [Lentzea sp. NPDC004782]|uniref:hypothetical protein n=1 Tax=Lentzea sp. NPDC004782 TaxID=3154458 RepID=UPI0033BE9438
MATLLVLVFLAPPALLLFAVTSLASTLIGLAAAARTLTRPAPVHPGPGLDPAYLTGSAPRAAWHRGRTAVRAAHDRLVALPDPSSRDSLFARLWRRQSTVVDDGALIVFPASLAGGYALGFATATLLIATTTAAHALLATLTVRAAARALRWFDTAQSVPVECATCRRLHHPAFRCPCGRLHRDLTPGPQGVLRRTCLCGHRLPTLLRTGKRALPALCGHCHAPLPLLPAAHFPVIGDRSAFAQAFPLADEQVHLEDWPFAGQADGLILVVDRSRANPKAVLDSAIDVLTETCGTAIPLAVVLIDPPGRQWLLDHGHIDLVNTADNHFTRVRYFVADDPLSPVRWLLAPAETDQQ